MMKIKSKRHKNVCRKKKTKFEDYRNCLEAAQVVNEIHHLEKSKVNVDSFRKDQKEFMKNKLILIAQQRFRSEKYNVFP